MSEREAAYTVGGIEVIPVAGTDDRVAVRMPRAVWLAVKPEVERMARGQTKGRADGDQGGGGGDFAHGGRVA